MRPGYTFLSNEGVSKSFRTGHQVQMVQLSDTRFSCITILLVSLVSFATITLCVATRRVFIAVSVHFVIDSVRKILGTPSYVRLYCSLSRSHTIIEVLQNSSENESVEK